MIKTIALLSSDKALGTIGGSLAVASLTFGVYMNVHGPAPDFGKSGNFTIFAQLAPKRQPRPTPAEHEAPKAKPAEELDMTATASIPKASRAQALAATSGATPEGAGFDAEDASSAQGTQIMSSATLESAETGAATVAIGGRARTVRVGDNVPGFGKVLEIRPGRRPLLRTTRGYIVSTRDD